MAQLLGRAPCTVLSLGAQEEVGAAPRVPTPLSLSVP